MEKLLINETALRTRVIEASPQQLREAADRLELAAKIAQFGEAVVLRFTSSITLAYHPELTSPAATGVLLQEGSNRESEHRGGVQH